MWNSTRRGRTITRRRKGAGRSNVNFKLIGLVAVTVVGIAGVALTISLISGAVANYKAKVEINKNNEEIKSEINNNINSDKENNNVEDKNENQNTNKNEDNKNDKDEIIESDAIVDVFEEEETYEPVRELKITALGEIMMGGKISQNVDYNYMSAFRYLSEYTKASDYTFAHLATNIVDLEEIGDTNSKYIVTAEIENAFNALGIDGLNIATDHMLDFGKEIFNDTKKFLSEDYDLIGLNNSIIYVEKDGVKVAIIGVCNETIGSSQSYTSAGIMMYNLNKVKALIETAKESASAVIVMTHLGNENSHTVTSSMKSTYKALVKAGADVVLGSHALGLYPIEIYKDKLIIYSLGYLMHDTSYESGKKSGIFDLTFNEHGELRKLEITPTYINAKKQTILMEDYNAKSVTDFLEYLAGNLKNCQIIDNRLVMHMDI